MQDGRPYTDVDRRALGAVATQFFVNGVVLASFVPRLPEVRDSVGITVAVLGLILTGGSMFGLVGSFGSSRVISALGTRRALLLGSTCLISTLPIIGFATNGWVLLVGIAGLAVFDVVVDIAMNIQASWLSERRHAPVMNRLHGLWSLGTVIGGIASARLAGAGVGLRTHLIAVAMLLLFVMIFVGQGLLREDEFDTDEESARVVDPLRVSRRSGPSMALIGLGLAGAFSIVMEATSNDWAAFRLSDDIGAPIGVAGLAFVAFTSGMTVGRFGGDAVLVRIGSERMFNIAIALSAIGLVGAAFGPDRNAIIASYFLAGVGISTFFPKLYDDAAKHKGKRGAGLGALTAGSRLAGLFGPATVGALAATSLSVGQATAVVTIPSVIGLALVTRAQA